MYMSHARYHLIMEYQQLYSCLLYLTLGPVLKDKTSENNM